MQRMFAFSLLLLFAAPPVLWAGGRHAGWNQRGGIRRSFQTPVRRTCGRRARLVGRFSRNRHRRFTPPVWRRPHPGFAEKHRRLTRGRERFHRRIRRHRVYWRPGEAVGVREEPPIVIVSIPPPPEPIPAREPQKVWVPPVMGTRMEAGYWDYAIKKVWKGDHWLYKQDFNKPRWVPPKTVEYVKQEGYWKIVE